MGDGHQHQPQQQAQDQQPDQMPASQSDPPMSSQQYNNSPQFLQAPCAQLSNQAAQSTQIQAGFSQPLQFRSPQSQGQTALGPTQVSRTAYSPGLPSVPPPPISACNPADSYLERVDFDPRFREMLVGAPSQTVHGGNRAGTYNPPDSASIFSVDKPLPDPSQAGRMRASSQRHAPNSSKNGSYNRSTRQGGESSQLSQVDRFPPFTRSQVDQQMIPVVFIDDRQQQDISSEVLHTNHG